MRHRRSPIRYSDAELAWIEERCHLPRTVLHTAFVAAFERYDVTKADITGLCKRRGWLTGRTGQFAKGRTPANKGKTMPAHPNSAATQFKPGERRGRANHTYAPIGTERLSAHGYRERKVNDDLPLHKRWRAVHLIEWERANGPIPAGHCLKCVDGDRMNAAPENWMLIPRALLPRLNGRWTGLKYDDADPEIKPYLLTLARLRQAAAEAKGNRKATG